MTRRLLSLVLLLLVLPTVWLSARSAHAADGALDSRLAAATEAFAKAGAADGIEARKSAYRRAAGLYDRALATGHRNGGLEYNVANAWFLAGDMGRAILHYRRALQLRPGDPQFEANLATARSRREDQIEAGSGRAVLETLFFWHGALSLPTKRGVGIAAYVLAFGLLGLLSLRPQLRSLRTVQISAFALLVIASALIVSAWVEAAHDADRQDAVLVADVMPLRKGDGFGYPPRFENPLHAGAEILVLEERGDWVRVALPDGKDGWLPITAIERI